MRLVGWLLVVMGVVLGAVGITMDPASRTVLMVGAGVLIGTGLVIALVATLIQARISNVTGDLQQQLAEFERQSGGTLPEGSMINAEADPMAILKAVMDAQNESGGDPDQLAKLLRERLGGDPTVIQREAEKPEA